MNPSSAKLFLNTASPMDNILVVDNILSWLILEDLLSARLVNRLWNSAALSFCRQLSCCKFKYSAKLKAFSKAMQRTQGFPISNFRFKLHKIKSEDCAAFLKMYGSCVRGLECYRYVFDEDEMEFFEEEESPTHIENNCNNFRLLLSTTPNLEYLSLLNLPNEIYGQLLSKTEDFKSSSKLEYLKIASDEEQKLDPRVLSILLQLFPKLSSLDCSELQFQSEEIPKGGKPAATLRQLAVHARSLFQLRALVQTQKLEAVKIKWSSSEQSQDISQLLLSQQNSLKTLCVEKGFLAETERLRLPRMQKLTVLDCSVHAWALGQAFAPFKLEHEQVRHLRKVLLGLDWGPDMFQDSDFSSVQHLVLVDEQSSSSTTQQSSLTDNMKKLGKLFPKLQRLECNESKLEDSALTAIFSSFPQLTHLDLLAHFLYFSKNLNLILSGFPLSSRRTLTQLIRSESPSLFSLKAPLWSMADLKRLKHLKIRFSAPRFGVFDINEIGVLLGFMRIPRLEQLTLLGKFCISENEAEKLAGCHGHVLISPVEDIVHGVGNPTHVPEKRRGADGGKGSFSW